MESDEGAAWRAPEHEVVLGAHDIAMQRELTLRDRIAGLEAENSALRASSALTPTEQLLAEQRLARFLASPSYRLARTLSAPARLLRRRRGGER